MKGGFGTFFGLSLLSGVGIALGLVVLIIPGIVVFVRWAPIYGFGLVDGDGVSAAFEKSWRLTGDHFVAILIAIAVPVAMYLAGFAILFFNFDAMGMIDLIPSAIANLLLALGGASVGAIGIAVYSLVRDNTAELTEVFE